jgi:sugar (pentulose or hexulose) kinase
MHQEYIAVFDVGKTNKKLIIYDTSLTPVETAYTQIDEIVTDGIHFENIDEIVSWLKRTLADFARTYRISAVSVATHGATALCLDGQGDLAVPPVAYTTEADESFREEFFATFGDPVTLQKETCTAEIGSMVNIAKLLFFMKKTYPAQFEKIQTVLSYPQYFGYILTGNVGAEPTYTGCHTYLYDFHRQRYSHVAHELGIAHALPQDIREPWSVLGTVTPKIAQETGLSQDCIVTCGIHDSNASLLPYMVKGYENFALNSTGTWCVGMHPTNTLQLHDNELGKLVFYFLSAYNTPVKSSIFMGGLEYDTYTSLLQEITGIDEPPPLDLHTYERIIREQQLFILPSVVHGTGIFPDARPRAIAHDDAFSLERIRAGTYPDFFKEYTTAYAVLTLSLALQTRQALSLIGYDGTGTLFIEGGFRNNAAYNTLLTALFPRAEVVLTNLQEATAFGAALLGKAALDTVRPEALGELFTIETSAVEKQTFSELDSYKKRFLQLLTRQ